MPFKCEMRQYMVDLNTMVKFIWFQISFIVNYFSESCSSGINQFFTSLKRTEVLKCIKEIFQKCRPWLSSYSFFFPFFNFVPAFSLRVLEHWETPVLLQIIKYRNVVEQFWYKLHKRIIYEILGLALKPPPPSNLQD